MPLLENLVFATEFCEVMYSVANSDGFCEGYCYVTWDGFCEGFDRRYISATNSVRISSFTCFVRNFATG